MVDLMGSKNMLRKLERKNLKLELEGEEMSAMNLKELVHNDIEFAEMDVAVARVENEGNQQGKELVSVEEFLKRELMVTEQDQEEETDGSEKRQAFRNREKVEYESILGIRDDSDEVQYYYDNQ
jgi:hypothetical protein